MNETSSKHRLIDPAPLAGTAEALQDWLRSRRSVRRFLNAPVPEELLARILETATRAPSAHNRQPWRFVVLRTQAARERLARAMGAEFARALEAEGKTPTDIQAALTRSRERILGAPAAVLLCVDSSAIDRYADENRSDGEEMMAVQSVAIAGGYMLLAAHAEGLGAVWVCAPLFAPVAVQEAISMPATWLPQAIILLGYPADVPAPRPRQPVAEIRLDV